MSNPPFYPYRYTYTYPYPCPYGYDMSNVYPSPQFGLQTQQWSEQALQQRIQNPRYATRRRQPPPIYVAPCPPFFSQVQSARHLTPSPLYMPPRPSSYPPAHHTQFLAPPMPSSQAPQSPWTPAQLPMLPRHHPALGFTPPTSPYEMSVDFEIKAGKIYYLPDGKYVPRTSIVHRQKKQEGFFMHPVLVLLVNGTHVHFYALTRVPPPAIRDLNMCMRIGSTTVDEGPDVLKLAETSGPMSHETWVNLDQRYKMEKQYLKQWSVDVELDAREVAKLQTRIDWLEAQQNRFIYKPLERDLSTVEPGTVLLLLNPRGAPTLGAPVVIFKTCYPWFLYLRVKQMRRNDRAWRDPDGCVHARRMRLAITREPGPGHDDDDTPAMLLTDDSPDFREPSYVELSRRPRGAGADRFRTWCCPFIRIQPRSMELMGEYLRNLPPAPQRPVSSPLEVPTASPALHPHPLPLGMTPDLITRLTDSMKHPTNEDPPPPSISTTPSNPPKMRRRKGRANEILTIDSIRIRTTTELIN